MVDADARSLRYLMGRHHVPRLSPLLRALMIEADERLPLETRQLLAVRLGARIAAEQPLIHGESLIALEQAMNQWLADVGWGWVTLEDRGSWLEVQHGCSPMYALLGEHGAEWGRAVMEGLFGGWLNQAGADASLQIRRLDGPFGPDQRLRYGLAAPSILAGLFNG